MRPSRAMAAAACFVLSSSIAASSCAPSERKLSPKSQTFGELRTVRHGVRVQQPGEDERAPYPRERLVDGQRISIDQGGLAWLRRDGGTSLLVAGPAALELRRDAIAMHSGKLFVDAPPGSVTDIITPLGPLHLSDVRASISADDKGSVNAYVLRGEVRTEGADFAGPGEELRLTKERTERAPVLAWDDWTGGLATTDQNAAPAPFGIGTVGARLPGELGEPRWPLAIQKLDVRVSIDADLAVTEVEQVFFNPTPSTVEGIYQFRTPPGAMLHRFGVDREQHIVWGYVKEKQQAAAQYESHVYAGSREDPALLEWDAPGVYRARLYPIAPGATRTVLTRYAQWLPRTGSLGERRLYVYPMAAEGAEASLPRIEEMTITVNVARAAAREVRVGMQGVRVGDEVIVREHDFVPRADLAVELFDAGLGGTRGFRGVHAPELDLLPPDARREAVRSAEGEHDYLLVPLRPAKLPPLSGGLDLAIVVDSSAATDPASLAVARAATHALLSHLGADDRAAVWAGDVSLRPVSETSDKLLVVDPARARSIALGIARVDRGGATDLGAILADAARVLDPNRRSAVVYIGDGKPTVGELTLANLRERLARLPRPVRLFAFGVGDGADMGILTGVTHGAFAERITDANEAARAALRLLEEAERPTWLGAEVFLGDGVERVYPRDLGARPADEPLLLLGRVTGELPKKVLVKAPGGETSIPLQIQNLADQGDLMRRWAEGRLVELLDTGAGRAAVVEVGMRYGIITPFTSMYVPTTDEARRDNLLTSRQPRSKPRTKPPGKSRRNLFERFTKADSSSDDEYETEQIAEANADNREGGTGTRAKGEEGSMGNPASRPTNKRYGVAGPRDNPDPHIARSAALREAAEFGMIGLLNTGAGGDADAPTATATATAAPAPSAAAEAPPPPSSPTPAPTPVAATAAPPEQPRKLAGAANVAHNEPADPSDVAAKADKAAESKDQPNADDIPDSSAKAADKLNAPGYLAGRTPSVAPSSGLRAKSVAAAAGPAEFGHQPTACGAAASIPLEERIALWRERLSAQRGSVPGVLNVYHQALALCEAPTWRERSRLLSLMVDATGSVHARVALWRNLASRPGVADAVYGMILVRIRNAAEMRELHDALGIKSIDEIALAAALKPATTPAQRVHVLRSLAAQWPDDLPLHVRLLHALEDADDAEGARDLARILRTKPNADASIRTDVGELHFRLARGATAERDKHEALRTFGEIVEFAPEDPVARRRLGDLLRAHGYHDQAARQYETLGLLLPDDPTIPLLRAAAAQGLGKVEEAVRWTEKAAASNAPDGASGSATTARAIALTYLAWARDSARASKQTDVLKRLLARTKVLLAADGTSQSLRVSLVWSHPDFHPVLWTDALGSMMPATEGDPSLGIAQGRLPTTRIGHLAVRLAPEEAVRAARFQLEAILTVVFAEGTPQESVVRLPVRFEHDKGSAIAFLVADGSVTHEVAR